MDGSDIIVGSIRRSVNFIESISESKNKYWMSRKVKSFAEGKKPEDFEGIKEIIHSLAKVVEEKCQLLSNGKTDRKYTKEIEELKFYKKEIAKIKNVIGKSVLFREESPLLDGAVKKIDDTLAGRRLVEKAVQQLSVVGPYPVLASEGTPIRLQFINFLKEKKAADRSLKLDSKNIGGLYKEFISKLGSKDDWLESTLKDQRLDDEFFVYTLSTRSISGNRYPKDNLLKKANEAIQSKPAHIPAPGAEHVRLSGDGAHKTDFYLKKIWQLLEKSTAKGGSIVLVDKKLLYADGKIDNPDVLLHILNELDRIAGKPGFWDIGFLHLIKANLNNNEWVMQNAAGNPQLTQKLDRFIAKIDTLQPPATNLTLHEALLAAFKDTSGQLRETLLVGYRWFFSTEEVFKALNEAALKGLTTQEKLSAIQFCRDWLKQDWLNLNEHPEQQKVGKLLEQVVHALQTDRDASVATSIKELKLLMKEKKNKEPKQTLQDVEQPGIASPQSLMRNLTSFFSHRHYNKAIKTLAADINQSMASTLRNMPIGELIKKNRDNPEASPHLAKVTAESNNLANFVSLQLLSPNLSLGQRKKLQKFFIDLAYYLAQGEGESKIKNYHAASMIYYGFSKQAVDRIGIKPAEDRKLDYLDALFSNPNNMQQIQDKLEEAEDRFIPFIPQLGKNLTAAEESPSQLENANGRWNIYKLKVLANIVSAFHSQIESLPESKRSMHYNLNDMEPNRNLGDLEKHLYELSWKIKPKKS